MKKKGIVWGKSKEEQLLKAAANYIEKAGGKALVIGGIGFMERGKYRHSLVINFTGKRPVKPTTLSKGGES